MDLWRAEMESSYFGFFFEVSGRGFWEGWGWDGKRGERSGGHTVLVTCAVVD